MTYDIWEFKIKRSLPFHADYCLIFFFTITKKYTCIENFDNTTVDLRSMLITS